MVQLTSKRMLASRPLFTAGCFIYFLGGYTLVNKYWPDSDVAPWILIAAGIVIGYFYLKRQQDRNQEPPS